MSDPKTRTDDGLATEIPNDDVDVARRRMSLPRVLKALADDRRGVIVVMFALMLPILIGFIGLGVEVGLWYSERRDLQAAADAGALAGAYEVAEGRSSNVGTVAQREAESNGWTTGTGTITVRSFPFNGNYPAAPSAYSADDNAVQVELTRQVSLLFAGYFLGSGGEITINTKAVGTYQAGPATACVLALAAGNPGQAVKTAGAGTDVTLSGCSVAVNSTDNQALKAQSGKITADCMYIEGAGGYQGTLGVNINPTQCSAPKSGQPEIADPYAGVPEPTAASCDGAHTNYRLNSGGVDTISAGTWCGGIEVTANSTLVMGPGLYIMDEGNFKITGGSNVSGADVTIVLMDSSGSNACGIFEISGGGALSLMAQTTGTYAGILVYRHATCSSTQGDMKFVGNSSSVISGAIYAPSKEVKISGGSSVVGSCLQIVADTIEFSGTGSLGSQCAGTGVKDILVGGKGILVE